MQPTLAITAPARGMIFINGRFSGEIVPEQVLLAPVAPFGAVYLEFKPLEGGWRSLTRKLVLSGGQPLPDSLSEGMYALCWPGGVSEIQLFPRREISEVPQVLNAEGLELRFFGGENAAAEVGSLRVPLPEGAALPSVSRTPGAILLLGRADKGQYLAALSPDLSRCSGILQADAFEFEPPDFLCAVLDSGDVLGHGVRERWKIDGGALHLSSSSPIWMDGAPRVLRSAEETARAAAEAVLDDRLSDALPCLSRELRARLPAEEIRSGHTLCLPMKYADGLSPCVGLVRVENERMARVQPLHYRAQFQDGHWMLTHLSLS